MYVQKERVVYAYKETLFSGQHNTWPHLRLRGVTKICGLYQ